MNRCLNVCTTAETLVARYERFLLLFIIACFAFAILFLQGTIMPHCDHPGYTDPAINYLQGRGFTSSCWYAQSIDDFWAGNVPLHQLLLIPWLAITGIGLYPVLWLNFLYLAAGIFFIWQALRRSGLIATAHWRLGAITFCLLSSSTYFIATTGRYDPLAFLLLALAAFLLTVQNQTRRFVGLFLVAALFPWAHLAIVVISALMGFLLLAFYPKRQWQNLLVFALGGTIGAIALVAFYSHHDVLDSFIKSVLPHTAGVDGAEKSGVFHAHRLSGLKVAGVVPLMLLTIGYALFTGFRRREWSLPLFISACTLAIPATLISTGVFSAHYIFLLVFPAAIFLFALLSREPILQRRAYPTIIALILLAVIIPQSTVRQSLRNRINTHHGDHTAEIAQFLQQTLRPDDIGWLAEELYYEARPQIPTIFTSPVVFSGFLGLNVSHPKQEKELASVTVSIWRDWEIADKFPRLIGRWEPTGEEMVLANTRYIVFRRVAPPPASLQGPQIALEK